MRSRLVVLVSGTGTNLAALLAACEDPAYGAEVVAVGADRDGIEALTLAADRGIATFVERLADHPDRGAWDAALAAHLEAAGPDLVVCAGFLKLLAGGLVRRWPTLNTHPALCPAFPGMHAVADALAYGVRITGATVFLVDEGVDTGPVAGQVAVPVRDGDTVETLHARIKTAEHGLLVDTVGRMVRDGYRIDGRRVLLGRTHEEMTPA